MALKEEPPFGRGETWYNGGPIDSANLAGAQMEGKEYYFPDNVWSATGQVGAKPSRTNRLVRCRVVRNVGAVAILPGQLVIFSLTSGVYGGRVDGLANTQAQRCYPADEFLPAAGVPVNDLFYIVVEGPALVYTPLAGADFVGNAIAVGDILVGLTAATSGATTAGRATGQDLSLSGATLAKEIQFQIGHALTAATSGQTNTGILCDVGKW